MYSVVAGVGIPAAFRFFPLAIRNATALALVVAWLVAEVIVYKTGNSLPVGFYFKADLAVIAAIYAKTIIRCGVKSYSPIGFHLRCLVTDLTLCDRWIVAIFLLGAWPLYVLNLDPYYKWQCLLWLAIIQFLLAGAEAIQSFRHDVKVRAKSDPPGNGLALAGAYRGHG